MRTHTPPLGNSFGSRTYTKRVRLYRNGRTERPEREGFGWTQHPRIITSAATASIHPRAHRPQNAPPTNAGNDPSQNCPVSAAGILILKLRRQFLSNPVHSACKALRDVARKGSPLGKNRSYIKLPTPGGFTRRHIKRPPQPEGWPISGRMHPQNKTAEDPEHNITPDTRVKRQPAPSLRQKRSKQYPVDSPIHRRGRKQRHRTMNRNNAKDNG